MKKRLTELNYMILLWQVRQFQVKPVSFMSFPKKLLVLEISLKLRLLNKMLENYKKKLMKFTEQQKLFLRLTKFLKKNKDNGIGQPQGIAPTTIYPLLYGTVPNRSSS